MDIMLAGILITVILLLIAGVSYLLYRSNLKK